MSTSAEAPATRNSTSADAVNKHANLCSLNFAPSSTMFDEKNYHGAVHQIWKCFGHLNGTIPKPKRNCSSGQTWEIETIFVMSFSCLIS